MEVQMHFRTDSWHYADMKAKGTDYVYEDQLPEDRQEFLDTPPAVPGDVWRIRWAVPGPDGVINSERDKDLVGPIAGYAICCSKCKGVHPWTTASNCEPKHKVHCGKDQQGNDLWADICEHSSKGSCWQWSGSAEDNILSASPSLLCQQPDCGLHGFLTNGILRDC